MKKNKKTKAQKSADVNRGIKSIKRHKKVRAEKHTQKIVEATEKNKAKAKQNAEIEKILKSQYKKTGEIMNPRYELMTFSQRVARAFRNK